MSSAVSGLPSHAGAEVKSDDRIVLTNRQQVRELGPDGGQELGLFELESRIGVELSKIVAAQHRGQPLEQLRFDLGQANAHALRNLDAQLDVGGLVFTLGVLDQDGLRRVALFARRQLHALDAVRGVAEQPLLPGAFDLAQQHRRRSAAAILQVTLGHDRDVRVLTQLPALRQLRHQLQVLVRGDEPFEDVVFPNLGRCLIGRDDGIELLGVADAGAQKGDQPLGVAFSLTGVGWHPSRRLQQERENG